jgi:hypothetical protein
MSTLARNGAQQVDCFAYSSTPKTEVLYFSETSLNFYRITQRYINVMKSKKYGVFTTSSPGMYRMLKNLCIFYLKTKVGSDIKTEAAGNLNILYVACSKGLYVLFL